MCHICQIIEMPNTYASSRGDDAVYSEYSSPAGASPEADTGGRSNYKKRGRNLNFEVRDIPIMCRPSPFSLFSCSHNNSLSINLSLSRTHRKYVD